MLTSLKQTNKIHPMKIILKDTFNNFIISRHRTVAAAVAARDAYSRRIKRENGQNSYIPMSIISFPFGEDIDNAIFEAEQMLSMR